MVFLKYYRYPTACLIVLLICGQGAMRAQSAGEYEIKAAFLHKFAAFVQWPEGTGRGPLCIGIVGDDPFGAALDEEMQGKMLNGRPYLVRRFRKADDLAPCQMVFISSSERQRLRVILSRMQAGVLTVGDMPRFCERGGMIGFEVLDRRVRLRINLEAAQRARLQVSSKLLSLAKLVGDTMQ